MYVTVIQILNVLQPQLQLQLLNLDQFQLLNLDQLQLPHLQPVIGASKLVV